MNDIVWFILFIYFLLMIAIIGMIFERKKKVKEFCRKHREVKIGMTKSAVIALYGDKFTISYLQDGTEKLEWAYHRRGVGHVYQDTITYYNSLTRKISVKFKNNRVIEVKSQNMDV